MTRERAAELLSEVTVLDDPEIAEAHRVAISALRQQEAATDRHQMTNADRIRAMSDKELGVWICKHALSCGCCVGVELCRSDDGIANGAVKWLQQPCGGCE